MAATFTRKGNLATLRGGGLIPKTNTFFPARPPSGVMSVDQYSPGAKGGEQVGYSTDGSGKFKYASHKNSRRQDPDLIHAPGTQSKPSGSTITK